MSLELRYFVLRPRAKSFDDIFATAAQRAMYEFAEVIEKTDPVLALDLRVWAGSEYTRQMKLKTKKEQEEEKANAS